MSVTETAGVITNVCHVKVGSYAIATPQGQGLGVGMSHVAIPVAGTVEVHLLGPATVDGYAAVLVFN